MSTRRLPVDRRTRQGAATIRDRDHRRHGQRSSESLKTDRNALRSDIVNTSETARENDRSDIAPFGGIGGKDPRRPPGFRIERGRTRLGTSCSIRYCEGAEMAGYRAILGDCVIAESSKAVLLEGNVYFPPAAVRQEFLRCTRAKSLCLWKGVASYYTIEADGVTARNAAWTYRHPSPLARKIKDHVAFWGAVQVSETDPALAP
jgi:uncharacterized protein (DUF427 family)